MGKGNLEVARLAEGFSISPTLKSDIAFEKSIDAYFRNGGVISDE